MGTRRLLLATALLLSARTLSAAAWIVPGTANVAGVNGTRFTCSLTLVNPGVLDRKVVLSLIPGPATVKPTDITYTIGPGSTLAFDNVMAEVWSLEGTGALRISTDAPLEVFAGIANQPLVSIPEIPPPSLGSALPAVAEDSLLAAGQTGHSAWAAQSADPASGQRTNVAVTFPDAAGGAATVTIFDDQGKDLASFGFDAAGPAFLQKSLASLLPAAVSAARVSIAITRGRACAYTGTIDNVTGDLTIFPADPAPVGPTASIGNGAAQVPGVGGAFWQTEVHLFNPSSKTVTSNAILLGFPDATVDFLPVAPGRTVLLPAILTSRFHVSGAAAGAVLWSADGPLVIQMRTSTPLPSQKGGTVGGGQRAIPLEAFQTAEDPPVELGDLAVGPFARTNLLVSAGLSGSALTFEALDSGGQSRGTARRTLPRLGWSELALADLFSIPASAGRLRVRVTVESGGANVQAAVVDAATGDPVFRESFPRPAVPRSDKPPLAAGTWGRADSLEGLQVDATTILVDRFCRKGTFPQPARLDSKGMFGVVGFYETNIGPTAGFTAALLGQTDGTTVTITVFTVSDDRPLDSPGVFLYGRPYTIPPGPCPIEY